MFIDSYELESIREMLYRLSERPFSGDCPIGRIDSAAAKERVELRREEYRSLSKKLDALASAAGYEFKEQEAGFVCVKRKR